MRTGNRLSIETFVRVHERRACGVSGPDNRDDVNAIEVVVLPLRHEGGVSAMSCKQFSGYCFDEHMFPCDEDKRIVVERLVDRGLQPVSIGDTKVRIDRQAEEYCSRLDRRERANIVV